MSQLANPPLLMGVLFMASIVSGLVTAMSVPKEQRDSGLWIAMGSPPVFIIVVALVTIF